MKRDHYDILDIPENASATWIERAHQKRVLAIEQDTSLNGKKRDSALADANEAHRVLTDEKLRAAYDVALLAKREAASQPSAIAKMMQIVLLVGLPLVAGGTYFYMDNQAKVRAQQEQAERIAEEARLEAKRIKFELDRKVAEELDRQEREKVERARIEAQRIAHEEEMRNSRFVPLPTLEQQAREKQAADLVERNRLIQEEIERRKIQLELERQKRFLQQSQRGY